MRPIPVILMAALAGTGCAAHAARDPAPVRAASAAAPSSASSKTDLAGLNDSQWRFVEVGGKPVPAGVTATLHLRHGRASGNAGCNGYGASWEMSTDGRTRFGAMMSTKMACLAPAGAMEVEHGVFEALRGAAAVRRDGATLVLLGTSGKPLAKLVPGGAT